MDEISRQFDALWNVALYLYLGLYLIFSALNLFLRRLHLAPLFRWVIWLPPSLLMLIALLLWASHRIFSVQTDWILAGVFGAIVSVSAVLGSGLIFSDQKNSLLRWGLIAVPVLVMGICIMIGLCIAGMLGIGY